MPEQANAATTDTGNTISGETTEETSQESGQETTQEETTTEGNEETSEEQASEESKEEKADVEFTPYNFEQDVKLPEGYELPEAAQTALNDMGKELGIPADKIQLAVDQFIKVNETYAQAQQEAALKEWEKGQETTKNTLLKDWGDDFEKNQTDVNKVLDRFFKGSFDHMLGKVEEGKTRDLKTRDLMPEHFEKGLFELSKVLSADTLETGEAASNGLKNRTLAQACQSKKT